MLVGSCLLLIIILSFGSPLIPAASNRTHDAVKLNIFQIGCGYFHERQDISIATFDPILYLPGSKKSLPCTALTPAVVRCNMTVLQSHPLIIAVELRAKNCTGTAPYSRVFAGTPINVTDTTQANENNTRQADETHVRRSILSEPSGGHIIRRPFHKPHTNDSDIHADHHYIELKMHIDSTFTLVPGSLSHKKHDLSLVKQIKILPPTKANAKDLASSISPSAALANCDAGFIFGARKILEGKIPIPSECIDAHTGVQGFKNHVVIGLGYSDYMTDEEIQQLPAPESRTLIKSARNELVFTNNMYNALTDAFTDAQLLVSDMRTDLVPEQRRPPIHVNLGDLLIIIGVLLPAIPVEAVAPALVVVGGSLVIYGTLMNEAEARETPETYNIVSDDFMQNMRDKTQESFYHLMNQTFFTKHNYTALDSFTAELVQGLPEIQTPIKQRAVAWAGTQFLNYYGFKVCDNPDDYSDCGCHRDNGLVSDCNDKIEGLDCRFAGGLNNNGAGYFYSLSGGNPSGNIAEFTKYLPDGNFTALCNNENGWNVTRGTCNRNDYPTHEDHCHCHQKGITIVIGHCK